MIVYSHFSILLLYTILSATSGIDAVVLRCDYGVNCGEVVGIYIGIIFGCIKACLSPSQPKESSPATTPTNDGDDASLQKENNQVAIDMENSQPLLKPNALDEELPKYKAIA